METAISLKNFSYYHSCQSFFLSGKVIEITKFSDKKYDANFFPVKKGSQISFKLESNNPEDFFHILPHELIVIKSTRSEESKNKGKDSSITFIVDEILPIQLLDKKSCETSMGN